MAAGQSITSELARAAKAAKAEDWQTAVAAYKAVLTRFPANKAAKKGLDALRPKAIPALMTQADTAQVARDWVKVEAALAAGVTLGVSEPVVLRGLAGARMELGAAPEALHTIEPVLKAAPGDARALNIKARALREMGDLAGALACLEAALGDPSYDARTHSSFAQTYSAGGDTAAARAHLERSLALEPESSETHNNLAHVTDYTADQTHLDQMRDSLARLSGEDPATAGLHFGLFKALDQLDQRQEAFAHLKKANRLAKQALGYDFKTDAIPYAFNKVLFKAAPKGTDLTGAPRPVFVTGLPRSGTTLVERILAADPRVRPCGELTVVSRPVGTLSRTILSRAKKVLTAQDLAALGQKIQSGLAAYAQGAEVVVDKMPLNFRWIGYICAALPEARIVHLQRDPMAVAWSNYRHQFGGQGVGFCYAFEDIVRFMVMERELMAHWRGLYPDRIHVLDYAELIKDPEGSTRSLAAFADLTWSEDWVHPEKASSMILTASAEQARRPIYGGSDEAWKRYAAELEPLRAGLETAGLIP